MRRARQPLAGRQVEHDSKVGLEVGKSDFFEKRDHARLGLPHLALIRARRINETVAQHKSAFFQRWSDQAVDMIDAGGGEQHRFSKRAKRSPASRQQEIP